MSRFIALLGFLGTFVFLARQEKKPEPGSLKAVPKPKKKKKVVRKPRPARKRRKLQFKFFVAVTGIEKFAVSSKDVKETILKKAHIGPGHGPAKINVKDAPGGYNVYIMWPDSSSGITPKEAKVLIEGTDPRLFLRVSKMKVSRA